MASDTKRLSREVRRKFRNEFELAVGKAVVECLSGAMPDGAVPMTGEFHCNYEIRITDTGVRAVASGKLFNTEHITRDVAVDMPGLVQALSAPK